MSGRKKMIGGDEGQNIPQMSRLHKASEKCLHSSLGSTLAGPQEKPDSSQLSGSCMQLLQLRKQIKQQLTDMRTDLQIRSLPKEHIDSSLNVSLKMAHLPLEQEVCSIRNKELALARMQSCSAILNVLQKDSTQNCSIKAVMAHCMDTCQKIQAVQTSNRQLEEKLADIRQRRMEIRIKQQDLFNQVKSCEEKKNRLHDLEMKAQVLGRENMESVANKVIIIQEILQRFVLSAQVNWAEDPYLTGLLLKIKDSPLS
ncbi:centromere protein H-like [Spea bombifrons]|uniref:centromere protein H-like n=1 Tax=Spea bombifrons TaxID=233779 RepID=UPI00234B06D0|nr:centromere protein H-like [Spea bombifrons]